MRQYLDAVRHVLERGTRKENRTGVDTISTFGHYYEIDLRDGFPLLTTKEVSWKNIVVELLWFLSGKTDIEILRRHGCKFWDAWADERGRVPSAYGNFWRKFPVHDWRETVVGGSGEFPIFGDDIPVHGYNDQIKWVVDELRKNPMSRRCVVSAWAPGNAQTSKLPPCHCMFVLNVQNMECTACSGDGWVYHHDLSGPERDGCPEDCRGELRPRLCFHLTQRSCDMALGVPYNIASYALLLELISRFTGVKSGVFGHTLVDAHVYTAKPDGSMADHDHVPGLREQLRREPRPLPKLVIDESIRTLADVEALLAPGVSTDEVMSRFRLEGYGPSPCDRLQGRGLALLRTSEFP